jgi:hypothetical protein
MAAELLASLEAEEAAEQSRSEKSKKKKKKKNKKNDRGGGDSDQPPTAENAPPSLLSVPPRRRVAAPAAATASPAAAVAMCSGSGVDDSGEQRDSGCGRGGGQATTPTPPSAAIERVPHCVLAHCSPPSFVASSPPPPPAAPPLGAASAHSSGTEGEREITNDGSVPLCEFDPPLGAFLARLGLCEHLPILVQEEMSLGVLKMLSEEQLHSNLSEMGLLRGARLKIIVGLTEMHEDDPDSAASGVVTRTVASATTATMSTTPEWFSQGFEDVS